LRSPQAGVQTVPEWDVFIAHSAADTTIARELFEHLKGRCRVFLDASNMRLGDDWHHSIARAQRESRYTVVLVSSATAQADYEREEIVAAIDLARRDSEAHRVVPVYLDGPPGDSIPYGLRLKQGVVLDRNTTIGTVASRLLAELKPPNGSATGSPGTDGGPANRPLRILFADDSLPMRRGVAALLEVEENIELVGEAAELDELLQAVDVLHPDVVLTDLRMPPTRTNEGVVAAKRLRVSHPDTAVVVLTQYADSECARSLVEDGSRGRGYLLKEHVSQTSHLLAAINAVASGGSYIDPDVVDALVSAKSSMSSSLDRLTTREREVLAELASGRSNAAIAQHLYVSERAVEKHINSMFAKLDLFSTADTNRRVQAALLFLAATGR
jgi:DNA-binding NarL/FixJ family response regulator